jgi:benzodiazapine receptor
VEVLVLLALIAATATAFWRASRLAALLLVPYLLWVGFASVLTWTLWRGNPGLL